MKDFVVVLDNIRSLHNVGSIFRTADGAGVRALYLCGVTPAPLDRFGRPRQPLTKVSLGAEKHVAWHVAASTARTITTLKREGYTIVALEQSAHSVSYDKVKVKKRAKMALVVGNEVKGIAPLLLKKADVVMEIPMHASKESLNVSVAFGIAAYGLARRITKTPR